MLLRHSPTSYAPVYGQASGIVRPSLRRISSRKRGVFGALVFLTVSGGMSPAIGSTAPPDAYAARAAFYVLPTASACPPGQMAPLLLAVVPSLIKQGFTFLQNLATERASEYDATVAATTADDVLINCGTLIKPNLKLRLGGLKFGYGVVSGPSSPDLPSEYKLLGFTKMPSLYIEGGFVGDSRHVRFAPTRFVYNKKLAKRGDVKDLVVTLSFNFPTASAVAKSKDTSTPSSEANQNSALAPTAVSSNNAPSGAPTAAIPTTGSTHTASPTQRRGTSATAPNTTRTPSNVAVSSTNAQGLTATAAAAGEGSTDANAAKSNTADPAALSGSTQSVQLPVFDHISNGSQINVASVTTGWIILPSESSDVKTDTHSSSLPVTLNIVVKETGEGNGSKVWLEIADAISSSESTIESAILGKSQSSTAASPASTQKK